MDALFRHCCFGVIAVLLASGCRLARQPEPLAWRPADQAPVIPLQLVSHDRQQDLPVTIEDARPAQERLYYPGSTVRHHWRDAVTMLPMEAFQPGIDEQLKSRIMVRAPVSILQVTVRIDSFQFIFDERQDAKGVFEGAREQWELGKSRSRAELALRRDAADEEDEEREQQREEQAARMDAMFAGSRRLRRDQPSDPEVSDSFLDRLVTGIFEKIGTWMLRSTLRGLKDALTVAEDRKKEVDEFTPKAQTLPAFITDGLQPGLTCRIRGTAMLVRADGTVVENPVDVELNQAVTAEPMQEQASRIAELAVSEFASQIIKEDSGGYRL